MAETSPAMTAAVLDRPGSGAVEERLARAFRYDAGPAGAFQPHAIAVETPIEIAYGGQPFAVMMGTPADFEDFAAGFSLTEGIIERFDEIRAIEARADEEAARIDVALSGERLRAHLARRRAIAGRTGCGVCGIEDLDHLPKARARRGACRPPSPAAVGAAVAGAGRASAAQRADPRRSCRRMVRRATATSVLRARMSAGTTRSTNASARCCASGFAPERGFFLVTSRCSFEMVDKGGGVWARRRWSRSPRRPRWRCAPPKASASP